ncbi:MAG: trypsin-like peptidase domain-containing protein [Mycobacteriales bacterium]
MSQTPNEMPQTPWWSQPGATAVLPPVPPAQPPTAAPHEPKRHRRPGTAALVALALVAGGAAGAGTATLVDNGSTTVVEGTRLSGTKVVEGTSGTVKGTPESAASVIGPSVVTVEVTGQGSNGFGIPSQQSDTGSGIIIRSEGYILTNNHVVSAAVGGGSVHVTLSDGKTVPARIVGTDPTTDLAVLKIDGASGLTAATFADSENLKVGQAVLAVGAPLGLANTVTQGIVSTLHRPVRTGDSSSQQAVIDAVQTDAAINPGNSGGALVDLAGRVVGINSAIATTGDSSSGQSGNIGVGFAIPSEVATKTADQLIASGKAVHSQMGVSVADAPNSTDGAPGLGAAIRDVVAGGPADKAGVQSGDVVTKVDDRRVTDADSLIVAVRSHDPGQTVTLTVTRGGRTLALKVTLASASS